MDEILVSTDDETIIKLAKNNISAPFLRPKHLSKDNSTAFDVLAHSANWFKNNYSKSIDYIMLLQPTSPLRTFNDIDNCIKLIVNTGSNTLVSVGKLHSPYDWTLKLNKNSNFFSFNKKKITKKSQLLDPAYFLNGAIFISKYNYYLGNKSFFSKKTCIYKMPFKRSIDIDEKDDLNLVKFYKSKKLNSYSFINIVKLILNIY